MFFARRSPNRCRLNNCAVDAHRMWVTRALGAASMHRRSWSSQKQTATGAIRVAAPGLTSEEREELKQLRKGELRAAPRE
jgi:hypothetical protein